MISKLVYPIESWKTVWNSEEVTCWRRQCQGSKYKHRRVGNAEKHRLSSVAGHLMNECMLDSMA